MSGQVRVRRAGRAVAVVLALAVSVAGCGGGGGGGTLPTPVDESPATQPSETPSVATPTSEPTVEPSRTTPTAPAGKPLVFVVPGRFAGNPAVQGLQRKYPIYFRALVLRDPKIVADNFPAYFYADTEAQIQIAKRNNWVMWTPGSIVVRNVEQRPFGIVRISSCRSQKTQYWSRVTRRWVKSTPAGTADVLDMIRRGDGWTMYRWISPPPKSFSCAGVRYPA
jgi:hypothetical protein